MKTFFRAMCCMLILSFLLTGCTIFEDEEEEDYEDDYDEDYEEDHLLLSAFEDEMVWFMGEMDEFSSDLCELDFSDYRASDLGLNYSKVKDYEDACTALYLYISENDGTCSQGKAEDAYIFLMHYIEELKNEISKLRYACEKLIESAPKIPKSLLD